MEYSRYQTALPLLQDKLVKEYQQSLQSHSKRK